MILVTGASGCLGSHLTRSLIAAGEIVAALKLPNDSAIALADIRESIEWRDGDLLDPSSLERALSGVTHIYHAAGIASPRPVDKKLMWAVNVQGTENLLKAALDAGVRRVVHVSSIAAIGYPDGQGDECMTYNGSSIPFGYMHTKYASEQVVHSFVAKGLDIVMVCPAAVIAPNCDLAQGWGRLFLDVSERRVKLVPPGGIDYLGSEDLTKGMISAMNKGRIGHRYILASGGASYREIVESFSLAAGVRPPMRIAPRSLVRLTALTFRLLEPILDLIAPSRRITAGVLELLWRRKHYSVAKAVNELGFRPHQRLHALSMETWRWVEKARA